MENRKHCLKRRVSFSDKSDIRYFGDSTLQEDSVEMEISEQDIIKCDDNLNKNVQMSTSFSTCSISLDENKENIPVGKSKEKNPDDDTHLFQPHESIDFEFPEPKRIPLPQKKLPSELLEKSHSILQELFSIPNSLDNELNKTFLNENNSHTYIFQRIYDMAISEWRTKCHGAMRSRNFSCKFTTSFQFKEVITMQSELLDSSKEAKKTIIANYNARQKMAYELIKNIAAFKKNIRSNIEQAQCLISNQKLEHETKLEEMNSETSKVHSLSDSLAQSFAKVSIKPLQGYLLQKCIQFDPARYTFEPPIVYHQILENLSHTNAIYVPNYRDSAKICQFIDKYKYPYLIRRDDTRPDVQSICILQNMLLVKVMATCSNEVDCVSSVTLNPEIYCEKYKKPLVESILRILIRSFRSCGLFQPNPCDNYKYSIEELSNILAVNLRNFHILFTDLNAIANMNQVYCLLLELDENGSDSIIDKYFEIHLKRSLNCINRIKFFVLLNLKHHVYLKFTFVPKDGRIIAVEADCSDDLIVCSVENKAYFNSLNKFLAMNFNSSQRPSSIVKMVVENFTHV